MFATLSIAYALTGEISPHEEVFLDSWVSSMYADAKSLADGAGSLPEAFTFEWDGELRQLTQLGVREEGNQGLFDLRAAS
eukprot:gene21909-37729_t